MTNDIEQTPERQSLRHTGVDDERIRECAIEAARLLNDRHCEDILVYDVRGASDVTDYIIIATGTSDRQIKSVGSEVEGVAEGFGLERFGREVDDLTNWLVIDLVDMVIHLFEPAARAHYDLEMMWGDSPQVKWRR